MKKNALVKSLAAMAEELADEEDAELKLTGAVLEVVCAVLAGETARDMEDLAMLTAFGTGRVLTSKRITSAERRIMMYPALNALQELVESDPKELSDDDRERAITLARRLLQKFATGRFRQQ